MAHAYPMVAMMPAPHVKTIGFVVSMPFSVNMAVIYSLVFVAPSSPRQPGAGI